MTTQIVISTNGNYISEGTLKTTDKELNVSSVSVRVGPGSNVQQTIPVPHGSSVILELTERDATPEEVKAAKKPDVAASKSAG